VTKIDLPNANVPLADRWLRNAGCTKIFHVNSLEGEGVPEILEYLKSDPPPKVSPEEARKGFRALRGSDTWSAGDSAGK